MLIKYNQTDINRLLEFFYESIQMDGIENFSDDISNTLDDTTKFLNNLDTLSEGSSSKSYISPSRREPSNNSSTFSLSIPDL